MFSKSARASPLVMILGAVLFFSAQVFAASAALGVDLGTEYIKAALIKPGIPFDIVLTKDSRRKETSAVAFKPSRVEVQAGQYPERLYGSDAIALAARFPGEVYPNLKTILGLSVDDAAVQEYAARHPALQLQGHATRNTAEFKTKTLTADEEAWTVEELLAMQLQSIQKNAEAAAGDGTSVRSVVLTVPPFFTTEEKRAVQTAAELAGLKVLGLISDGLAVGLNYATTRQFPNIKNAKPEYHLVFDMGAGSTKATVMRFQSRDVKDIGKFNKTIQEVQAIGAGWDRTLGGDILNNLIIDDMISKFVDSKAAKKASVTAEAVKKHGRAIAKLTKEAERIRHVLSANQNTGASFEGLYDDVDFKYKLARADFEALTASHAERVAATVNDALKAAKLDINDLDSVILHGGASRTPFVQKALENVVGSTEKLRSNVNSDEAAVFGAGFRAAELSPGFRVKEIRISDGPGYAGGLKWTSGSKEKTQRLWTPISTIGGPAKEITFTEEADFSGSFYQQVGEVSKDIKSFTTKNLTASVAALKEKYPTCVDSGVSFRLGVQLNAENGEADIVKSAVECEAEVKEGFVDGVKNLFGFGKKDQEPLKGEETESVEASGDEKKTSSTSSSASSSSSSSASASASGSTEEMKPEAKKLQTVSIPVQIVTEKQGRPELTKEETQKSKDKLKAFAASDKARLLREEALNQLESFTYRVRDLLEDEAFIAASTESEREKLAQKASEASEWLSDDGADAPRDQLKAKLKEIQDLSSPIQKRVKESNGRPVVIEKLKSALDQTDKFVDTMRQQIDEYEKFQASSSAASSTETASPSAGEFDGLEDEDASKGKASDEAASDPGPLPPLYKIEDIDELAALSKSTAEWLSESDAKQAKLPPNANPVLLVQDVQAKLDKLEKLGRDLAMKGVRSFNAKTSNKDKAKKNKKSSSSASASGSKTQDADAPKVTIPINGEDKVFSAEELEEMINNMSEEDWDLARKQAEEVEKKAKESSQGHDEL